MTPKLIHDDGWDLGQKWTLGLYLDVVSISYDLRMTWEWEGGPAPLEKAIAKALLNPIDPIILGDGVQVEGHPDSITIFTPTLRIDMEAAPARGLVEMLRKRHRQHQEVRL